MADKVLRDALCPVLAVGPKAAHPTVRALTGDAEFLGDMSHRPALVDDSRDKQTTAIQAQTSVSVGHEDLLVCEDLDISTKPGGPPEVNDLV